MPLPIFQKNNLTKEYNETLIEADWIIGCAIIIDLDKFVDKIVFDENIFSNRETKEKLYYN